MKIYGNIRVFKEEKAIVGSHIKRIEKFDEVTNHFLSIFVANCIRKKGLVRPKDLTPAFIEPNPSKDLDNHMKELQKSNTPQSVSSKITTATTSSNQTVLSDEELQKGVVDAMNEFLKVK